MRQPPAVLNESLPEVVLQFLTKLIGEGKVSQKDGPGSLGLEGPAHQ